MPRQRMMPLSPTIFKPSLSGNFVIYPPCRAPTPYPSGRFSIPSEPVPALITSLVLEKAMTVFIHGRDADSPASTCSVRREANPSGNDEKILEKRYCGSSKTIPIHLVGPRNGTSGRSAQLIVLLIGWHLRLPLPEQPAHDNSHFPGFPRLPGSQVFLLADIFP